VNLTLILISSAIVLLVGLWMFRDKLRARAVPAALEPGKTLPDFTAVDENGNPVSSADLRGRPSVLLFVRGTWCPFCSKQVQTLTKFYKDINESGAHLILVTPKPLETTRRVADFFGVKFEFWLDESLEVVKQLGLVLESSVPNDYQQEYGNDTLWPTSIVVDGDGTIRHTELSRFIADRPNPEKLLAIVKNL
jgi:peroxiredoxin